MLEMMILDNHFCNLVRLSRSKYPWVKAVVLFNFLTGTNIFIVLNNIDYHCIIKIITFEFSMENQSLCLLVYLLNRKNAEEALEALNGTVIGKQTVRLSWGRSPGNKHVRC